MATKHSRTLNALTVPLLSLLAVKFSLRLTNCPVSTSKYQTGIDFY